MAMRIALGQITETLDELETDASIRADVPKNPAAVEFGRRGGLRGGRARADSLSAEERQAIASGRSGTLGDAGDVRRRHCGHNAHAPIARYERRSGGAVHQRHPAGPGRGNLLLHHRRAAAGQAGRACTPTMGAKLGRGVTHIRRATSRLNFRSRWGWSGRRPISSSLR